MINHTLQSITRRASAAVKAAHGLFAGSSMVGCGASERLYKALARLHRVERDVRFLENHEAGYAAIAAAGSAIAADHAACLAEQTAENQAQSEYLEGCVVAERRASFASRANWNLSGGR